LEKNAICSCEFLNSAQFLGLRKDITQDGLDEKLLNEIRDTIEKCSSV
jgi:hypothetical protein